MDTSDSNARSFSIIGTGRVGTHLASALVSAGFVPQVLVSKTGRSAIRLSNALKAEAAIITLPAVMAEKSTISGDVVFICVPDDVLPAVVESLAEKEALSGNQVVFHTSGGLTSSVLSPLAGKGCSLGSFHPLQTFAHRDAVSVDSEIFSGLPVAIEGDGPAVETGFFLAYALGSRPILLNAEAKLLYHSAAVISSNFLSTVLASANGILSAISDSPGLSLDLFKPLAETAIRNSFLLGPENAITGPVVRGDLGLLKAHLESIAIRSPDSLPLYVFLSRETMKMSCNAGHLSEETASSMEEILKLYAESGSS